MLPQTPEERFGILEERSRTASSERKEMREDIKTIAAVSMRTETKVDFLIEQSGNHLMPLKMKVGLGTGGLVTLGSALGAFLKSVGVF